MWEHGFKFGNKFSSNNFLDYNSLYQYKYGSPSIDKLADSKSPYFKFGLTNNLMGGMMPTPGKQVMPHCEPQFFPNSFKPTTNTAMTTSFSKPG